MRMENLRWVLTSSAIGILLLMLPNPLSEAWARNRGFLELTSVVLRTPAPIGESEHNNLVALFQAGGIKQALGAGMVELFSGHCTLAVTHFQKYLTSHPSDQITHYWIGQCDAKDGDWTSAIQNWKAGRLLRPLQDAGNRLASQQNWQLASQAYQAVLTLTPNDCVYRAYAVSATWWATLDTPTAISQIKQVIADCPDEVEAYLVVGRILIENSQFTDAERYLIKARELAPNADSPLVSLALLRLRQERAKDALALLQAAIRMNPNRALSFAMLGYADIALGQPSQAVNAYETAIRMDANQAWVYEALGAAYEAEGEKDNARSAYQHALALDPNREGARARLAKLYPK